MDVLAGTDFFTAEVLTWRGLATYYVLFFIHLGNRRVSIAGITDHPDATRNATMEELGCLHPCRYLLHDRDSKFCESFREVLKAGGIKPLKQPARSPNLNAFAERWVRSVKEECLSRLILFGESSLRRTVTAFVEHYHRERNHQGRGNVLLFPTAEQRVGSRDGKVRCKERLGGLLKYYHREAA
jgi:transposase InsO family protein